MDTTRHGAPPPLPPPQPPPMAGRRDALRRRATGTSSDPVVAGVATRIGERLGVDPMFVRLSFVALTAAGGVGLVVYLVLWALGQTRSAPSTRPRRATTQQAVALGFVLVGVVILLRDAGLWFGDGLSWPVVAVALASAVLWTRGDDARAGMDQVVGRLREQSARSPAVGSLGGALEQIGRWRALAGGGLLLVGIAGVLANSGSLGALVKVFVAMGVTVLGIGLVLGPWLRSLVTELSAERSERVRQEERARMAAHLHDSVLQTLALIQRTADQPSRTVALARRQERELRAWLYGGANHGAATLRGAVAEIVEDVEQDHPVTVDSVVVGDAAADDAVDALAGALREAVVNAAKHAGVADIRVFVEVEPDRIVGAVLDRGVGFDPNAVGPDRRGIADSMRRRLERAGGRCRITTSPGEGTDVELEVPHRSAPATAGVDASTATADAASDPTAADAADHDGSQP